MFVFKSIPVIVPFADYEQDSSSDDSADHDEEILVTIVLLLQCSIHYVFLCSPDHHQVRIRHQRL